MGKRISWREDDSFLTNVHRKRVKTVPEATTSEEVFTTRQLKQLLTFEQDTSKARHGLQSFKLLLDDILEGKEGCTEKRQIVKEYIVSTRPSPGEDSQTHLSELMKTWSFAGQLSNEGVMAAIPVVLTLVLRVLSTDLEAVEDGLRICRTILQPRQQELVARNLGMDKSKGFILSPTLRMLREVLIFDGGAMAKAVFRGRNHTFRSLARNMGIRYAWDSRDSKGAAAAAEEERKRPSVRTNAVLFFLSAVKFLPAQAQKELLQHQVVQALTRHLVEDPPYLAYQILTTLRTHVLQDEMVSRDAKKRLLSTSTLVRIAALDSLTADPNPDKEGEGKPPAVDEAVHGFLMAACTVPSAGLLRQQTGMYPPEVGDQDSLTVLDSELRDELTLEHLGWTEKFKEEVPLRNKVLADFIQSLRPWSNLKHSELLLDIFRCTPELVANYLVRYLLKKTNFTFEPKLTATWVGYASFIFSVITLPIPEYFGWESGYSALPPPTSVVIENILPTLLCQKAIRSCWTSKSKLISFFATRILVASLAKLGDAIKLHQDEAHARKALWIEASRRLVEEFGRRAPPIHEMINSYRSIPEDELVHRETGSRLLRLYYEMIPQNGMMANFDVSPFLEKAAKNLEDNEEVHIEDEKMDARDSALRLMDLENLLIVAMYSPGMRWFSTSEYMGLSTFTAFLRVHVEAAKGFSLSKLMDVLTFVAEEQQLIQPGMSRNGLEPLLEALRALQNSVTEPITSIWAFLDKCLTRCATKPVRYREMVLELAPAREGTVSPLSVVMQEQLPFFVKSAPVRDVENLARFSSQYFGRSILAGEDRSFLEGVFGKMKDAFNPKAVAAALMDISFATALLDTKTAAAEKADSSSDQMGVASANVDICIELRKSDDRLDAMLDAEDALRADHSALTKWSSRSVDELVEEEYATKLISLLVSEYTSIRKEALTNLVKMAAKVHQSEYVEKEQVWLLLSELVETARPHVDAGTLPSPVVAFACHALGVLQDPLHCLYAKVNDFLLHGPSWRVEKVPLVLEVIQDEPGVDGTYYAQVSWLLTYILDCLRTPADVQLFRRTRMFGPLFERLLALVANPYIRRPLMEQLLRVLYRVTKIEGGAATLVTRFGLVGWLRMQAEQAGQDGGETYRALERRVIRIGMKEEGRLQGWSKGGLRSAAG